MSAMPDTARPGLDEPVPYTLTIKARALVPPPAAPPAPDLDEAGVVEWACHVCGSAWFGPVPDDGRCRDCRDDS